MGSLAVNDQKKSGVARTQTSQVSDANSAKSDNNSVSVDLLSEKVTSMARPPDKHGTC